MYSYIGAYSSGKAEKKLHVTHHNLDRRDRRARATATHGTFRRLHVKTTGLHCTGVRELSTLLILSIAGTAQIDMIDHGSYKVNHARGGIG